MRLKKRRTVLAIPISCNAMPANVGFIRQDGVVSCKICGLLEARYICWAEQKINMEEIKKIV